MHRRRWAAHRRADVKPGVWKHLRAALVLAHVLTMVLAAIPAPVNGMNRAMWKNPTAKMEFETWARGLRMKPDEFEELIWKLANLWMSIREVYLTPVNPWIRLTGTEQPWRMFVGPDRFPPRYQLAMKVQSGEWLTLYEERSQAYTWRADYFDQERARSYLYRYAWPEFSGWAETACRHFAKEVFAERPEAVEVRCRVHKRRSPSPDEVRAGKPPDPGEWFHVYVIPR